MRAKEKAPDDAGALVSPEAWPRSIPRDQRAAEFIAEPGNRRLNIVRPRVERIYRRSGAAAELIALGLEGRIVVFEADNPVLGNSVFPARADGPAVVPLGSRARADI